MLIPNQILTFLTMKKRQLFRMGAALFAVLLGLGFSLWLVWVPALASPSAPSDLVIRQAYTPAEILAGSTTTYTLVVENQGSSPARNVVLTETLTGAAFTLEEQPAASQGECQESTPVVCDLFQIDGNDAVTVTILILPASSVPEGTIVTSTATVSSTNGGLITNVLTAVLQTRADLGLSKIVSQPQVAVGERLTYTLSITNSGPSLAAEVLLTDSLPAALFEPEYSQNGGETWNAWKGSLELEALDAQAHRSILLRGLVGDSILDRLVNTATVSTRTDETWLEDNTDSASVTIIKDADLALDMQASATVILVGQPVTYTLTASNAGPTRAQGVMLVFTLPGGAQFVPEDSTGDCIQAGNLVTCSLGMLPEGGQAVVALVIEPGTVGEFTTEATVVATPPRDPNLTNNTDQAQLKVLLHWRAFLPISFRNYIYWQPILVDDFASGKVWTLMPSDIGDDGIENGEYFLRTTATPQLVTALAPIERGFDDFRLTVDMHASLGDDTRYGVIFDWLSPADYCVLYIRPSDGAYSLWHYQGGWVSLVGWTPGPSIARNYETNHVRLTRIGTQLEISINGIVLPMVEDSPVAGGRVGLHLWGRNDPPAEARFDNFVLESLP